MTKTLGSALLYGLVVMMFLGLACASASAVDLPGSEKKVTIDQLPAKVRAAILKEVGEGRLVDIGVFTRDDGSKLYEIEMIVDGKEFDVLFDGDGKVLRKTFEGLKPGEVPKKKTAKKPAGKPDRFQRNFGLEERKFATFGRSKYFILEPGYRLILEGKEGEHTVRLAVTVLHETRVVGGVRTRVVEERETVDGELLEISRNF
ncbi:MAG: PepSY domain-containing protein, partial [Planctomycetota bacterium]